MKQRKLWLVLASLLSLALIAAACGSDDDDTTAPSDTTAPATTAAPAGTDAPADTDAPATTAAPDAPATTEEEMMDDEMMDDEMVDESLEGTTVIISGPESSDVEAGAITDALDIFAERTGINIEYTGARDFSDQINIQVAAGNPPDIAIFPQPGKAADFARDGEILPLPAELADLVDNNWPAAWVAFGNVDGTQYSIPTKSDLKSLVWYQPARFEAEGYEVPETWGEMKSLAAEMIGNGHTPFCIGTESGPATGWLFTDWVEDVMLRLYPPEDYDAWVAGDLLFSSDQVRTAWTEVLDIWNTPGAVFSAGGTISATPFQDNTEPLLDGTCLMHRQASFFASFFPAGTVFADGSDNAVDVFFLPAATPDERPALVAGTIASAFRDAPEVWAVMEFLASPEYAVERQKAQKARSGNQISGFLSAAFDQDLTYYSPLEQSFLGILTSATVARFDASDLMPAAVGAGTFWTVGTDAVNGQKSIEEATSEIDDSWPR